MKSKTLFCEWKYLEIFHEIDVLLNSYIYAHIYYIHYILYDLCEQQFVKERNFTFILGQNLLLY